MDANIIRIFKTVAATAFLAALVINISVTLTDPFIMMSDAAVAQTSTTTSTTSTMDCKTEVDYLMVVTDCPDNFPLVEGLVFIRLSCLFAEGTGTCTNAEQVAEVECSGINWSTPTTIWEMIVDCQ